MQCLKKSTYLLNHFEVDAFALFFRLLNDKLVRARDLDPVKRYVPLHERHKVSMRYSTFTGVLSDTIIQVCSMLLF